MKNNNYFVIAPNTPTYFPDISFHKPDVLDIAIVRTNSLQYNIENINHLFSNHNLVLLEIYDQTQWSGKSYTKTLTNSGTNFNSICTTQYLIITHSFLQSPIYMKKPDLDKTYLSINGANLFKKKYKFKMWYIFYFYFCLL